MHVQEWVCRNSSLSFSTMAWASPSTQRIVPSRALTFPILYTPYSAVLLLQNQADIASRGHKKDWKNKKEWRSDMHETSSFSWLIYLYICPQDRKHVFKVPAGDPTMDFDNMYKAVLELEGNPEQAKYIAEEGRKFVEDILTVQNVQRYRLHTPARFVIPLIYQCFGSLWSLYSM